MLTSFFGRILIGAAAAIIGLAAMEPAICSAQAPLDSAAAMPAAGRVVSPKSALDATAPKGVAPSRRSKGKPPCLAWINPDIPAKAVLLCVHGLGLHNQSYEDFGKRMAAIGVPTYAVDVRGFGSWMNNPAQNEVDFDDCLQDIYDTLKVLHRVHPGLPVFVLGESMGGAIALRATAMYPELIDGLISCVPSGDRFRQGRTELKVALRIFGGYNKPFDIGHEIIEQASGTTSADSGGTANKTLASSWLNGGAGQSSESLNRLKLSPKELIQFQRFMNGNHEWAAQLKTKPVLMLQGDDDNLVDPQGTLQLLHNIPVTNREVFLVVIRDAKHLIFEEAQSNDQRFNSKVLKLVNVWIDDHLKKPESEVTQTTPTPQDKAQGEQ